MNLAVTAFYKFTPLPEESLEAIRGELSVFGDKHAMGGLTIIGTEGVNGTVAGSSEVIANWKNLIERIAGETSFKDSEASEQPFKRWFVKIREEIVSLGNPAVIPAGKHHHLSPEEWDNISKQENVVILDARNTYETDIGMFEGAVDPRLKNFQDFPAWVKQCAIPKEKKVLLYCTGGIRCEKACLEMERQGYGNVFQLEGGILGYLAKKPKGTWRGECFVFDHRVSLDSDLKPSSRYSLCPHCGDPGDREIVCKYCKKEGVICARCEKIADRTSCSKNCSHHLIRAGEKSAVRR